MRRMSENETRRGTGDDAAFSLVRGGPTYRLLRRLRILRHDGSDAWRLPLAAFAVAWLPLVAIGLFELRVHPEANAIMRDLAVHARLALALPAFALAEVVVDFHTQRATARFAASGLLEGHERQLDPLLSTTARLRDSGIVELALLVVALVMAPLNLMGVGPWHDAADPIGVPEWSFTRTWYAWVALPLFGSSSISKTSRPRYSWSSNSLRRKRAYKFVASLKR